MGTFQEKDKRVMEDKFKNEIVAAVLERTIRRLWILCIILIAALIASNTAWICYESQFEDVVTTETIEADGGDGGDATGIIGNNNEVNNGESKSDENDESPEEKNRGK